MRANLLLDQLHIVLLGEGEGRVSFSEGEGEGEGEGVKGGQGEGEGEGQGEDKGEGEGEGEGCCILHVPHLCTFLTPTPALSPLHLTPVHLTAPPSPSPWSASWTAPTRCPPSVTHRHHQHLHQGLTYS